jgi:Neuraminidase (sialidase)
MPVIFHSRWRLSIPIALALLALIVSLVFTLVYRGFTQAAGEPLVQLSSDPFHNKISQHKTEVEPDTFAFGNTIVSGFQVGRVFNGGAADIGFATSNDGGKTFINGFLPGITTVSPHPGPYIRASDASVAFDAKHKVWLISSLGLFPGGNTSEVDLLVSRSTDGGRTWSTPIVAATGDLDKNWTVCDDTSTSPFYGHCYSEFDNPADGDRILMSTSTDGGLTWGPPKETANHDFGIGGNRSCSRAVE